MSAAVNQVVLVGNATADPELRYTQGGTARTRFSIAVNRYFKDASGQRKEETAFIPICVWGARAEAVANYVKKGRQVAVIGRIRTYSIEQDDGSKKSGFEVQANDVQFLGSKPQGDAAEPEEIAEAGDSPVPPEEEVPF
jgi:single-strand DNA-binding protein